MTIARKIELLEAMERNEYAMYELHTEEGKQEQAQRNLNNSLTLTTVIQILKDNKFAEKMAECYQV